MSLEQAVSRLAGSLQVRPGQRPALSGGRPPLAGRLLRGQPWQAAAQRLPLLYSLCGQAHRLSAELAVQAARHGHAEASEAARQALHAEVRREHQRHIVLDWPRLLASPGNHSAALGAHLGEDPRAWFGVSPQAWLRAWYDDPRGALQTFSDGREHWLARLLSACRQRAEALALPLRALPLEAGSLRSIAHDLQRREGFVRRPELAGQPCETGAWTRAHAASSPVCDNAWLRLGARLADLAELSLEHPRPLALGALAMAEGQALAWCETARGLLLHRVHVETHGPQPRICDYQILAPTEWNLHPRGALARALEALPCDSSVRRQAELLLAVYDPCLAYQIEVGAPERPAPSASDSGAYPHA
ncbi:TPA: HoxV [Pseudomonas aeruginosa]|uniref:hypothetical protein n=1 Tax=Pseudomonas aeruginosa TaxID=287 RepID=UPI0003B9AABF|nr:hypothetical protein [Pseudomonas aeruginosa]EKX3870071.1 HoxV [Pseudomonas aeruginosa]ERV81033.1 hypothetical protein Q058_00104 [Pseudomonas aeruginosa BL04]KSD47308.1 hypothetical protein AO901_02005 [Pseudomonas aeruginosa]KSE19817.1 hypothetical protein AO922_05985 [Pseudomonas aeruginosa]MBG5152088.1 HoxV [Pseudomonas aeruginosa]